MLLIPFTVNSSCVNFMQCVCTRHTSVGHSLSLCILWNFGLNNWIQKESSPAMTWTSGNINARNNSRPLAIFQTISGFGRPKFILISQISCTFLMGQQSVTYKISYLQKKGQLVSDACFWHCNMQSILPEWSLIAWGVDTYRHTNTHVVNKSTSRNQITLLLLLL